MRHAHWPAEKLRAALERGYFRTADLFAGCGGMTLGFHRAKYRCVVAVEQNPAARKSHAANFAPLAPLEGYVAHGDITKVESFDAVSHLARTKDRKRSVIDVIIGGPPCQAFSRLGRAALWDIAGKKHAHAEDPRATLYEHFLSYVEDLRPIAFVMENVPDMGRFHKKNVAEDIALAARDLGYVTRYALLNACWYGVPQFRERMIIIGIRRELRTVPGFPLRTHTCDIPSGYATSRAGRGTPPVLEPHDYFVDHTADEERRKPAVTVTQAFRDLPEIRDHLNGHRITRNLDALHEYRARPSGFSARMREWPNFRSNGACDCHVIRLTPRDYPLFRRMREGDAYPDAVRIAERIFAARLRRAERETREEIATNSARWKAVRKEVVPPYAVDKFVDKYHKLSSASPAGTVPAHLGKDCYSHIHPDGSQARTISIREAARLQSFPDGFQLCGNMGERFTQIGNAVPPLLAHAIAAHLRLQLRNAHKGLTDRGARRR